MMKRMVWMVLCCCALLQSAMADDAKGKTAPNEMRNIGFMENPPKELKEKFPMCDAFLKVEWIDKEKKIGYSNYEAIIKTKDGQFKGKKMVWALVDLDVPGIDYDVYQYKERDRLEEVFHWVRNGKVTVGIPMMISYKGETMKLYGGNAVNYDALTPLLSDHRQTVCVAYPDEQRAWIVEGKNVKQTYSKEQIDELAQNIKVSTGQQASRRYLESLWLLDINFDGISDFIFEDTFFYSKGNRLYGAVKEFKYPDFVFLFPPSNRECRMKHLNRYAVTTDGRSFYFNGQCNLTDLTTPSAKE